MKKLTGTFQEDVKNPTKCKIKIIQQWERAVCKNSKILSWSRS